MTERDIKQPGNTPQPEQADSLSQIKRQLEATGEFGIGIHALIEEGLLAPSVSRDVDVSSSPEDEPIILDENTARHEVGEAYTDTDETVFSLVTRAQESAVKVPASEEVAAPEVETSAESIGKFKLRMAREEDIDAIVDVDLETFAPVYSTYGQNQEQLRSEKKKQYLHRLKKVGREWMPVLEKDGKIVGVMMCCPTSKSPEDFESWEQTTDNGTLKSTYDPNGKYLYVVTLSVLPEGSQAKGMLFAHHMGKLLKNGFKLAFFESRLPGLRQWIIDTKLNGNEGALEHLTEAQKDLLANQYFEEPIKLKGRKVKRDKHIRLYERIGCKFQRVVANAYQDEPSLNYGVVCVYDGTSLFDGTDLKHKIPDNRATRWMLGNVLQSAARSQGVTKSILG